LADFRLISQGKAYRHGGSSNDLGNCPEAGFVRFFVHCDWDITTQYAQAIKAKLLPATFRKVNISLFYEVGSFKNMNAIKKLARMVALEICAPRG